MIIILDCIISFHVFYKWIVTQTKKDSNCWLGSNPQLCEFMRHLLHVCEYMNFTETWIPQAPAQTH